MVIIMCVGVALAALFAVGVYLRARDFTSLNPDKEPAKIHSIEERDR